MTKKQMILDYVALKDGATYTEIIKFIYELNHPGKKYNWRSNRGYYSCAFWDGGYFSKRGHLITPGKFDEYLTKIDGKYYTVRKGKLCVSEKFLVTEWNGEKCTGPNCC